MIIVIVVDIITAAADETVFWGLPFEYKASYEQILIKFLEGWTCHKDELIYIFVAIWMDSESCTILCH